MTIDLEIANGDETIDVKITGEAADQINEMAKRSGASVATFIGNAIAAKKWIDDNVRGGRLYIMGANGVLREVKPT